MNKKTCLKTLGTNKIYSSMSPPSLQNVNRFSASSLIVADNIVLQLWTIFLCFQLRVSFTQRVRIGYMRIFIDRGNLSSIQVTNMKLIYWSVCSSSKSALGWDKVGISASCDYHFSRGHKNLVQNTINNIFTIKLINTPFIRPLLPLNKGG